MKWETHKKLTLEAAKLLGIDEEKAEELAEASILPDREPDRISGKRVPHHSKTALKLALSYMYAARKHYLRRDKNYIRLLGRALHYL